MEKYKYTKKENGESVYGYQMNFLGPFSNPHRKRQKKFYFDDNLYDYEVEFHAMILNSRATMASLFALAAVTAAYVN